MWRRVDRGDARDDWREVCEDLGLQVLYVTSLHFGCRLAHIIKQGVAGVQRVAADRQIGIEGGELLSCWPRWQGGLWVTNGAQKGSGARWGRGESTDHFGCEQAKQRRHIRDWHGWQRQYTKRTAAFFFSYIAIKSQHCTLCISSSSTGSQGRHCYQPSAVRSSVQSTSPMS